jgi:hypothetical protein
MDTGADLSPMTWLPKLTLVGPAVTFARAAVLNVSIANAAITTTNNLALKFSVSLISFLLPSLSRDGASLNFLGWGAPERAEG